MSGCVIQLARHPIRTKLPKENVKDKRIITSYCQDQYFLVIRTLQQVSPHSGRGKEKKIAGKRWKDETPQTKQTG